MNHVPSSLSCGSAEFQHFTFEAWLLVPADIAPEGLPAPSPAVAMLLGWLPASSAMIETIVHQVIVHHRINKILLKLA